MKKLLVTLIGALSLGATLPAWAGPDWQVIEAARKARHGAEGARFEALPPTAAGAQKCPLDKLVLPLDHGPRAQTTPYQNQLRKERYEARLTACKEAAK